MNCQEFWNTVPQRADAAALANHEHPAQCPACALRLRNQFALRRGLRAMAGQMSRVEAPARVETQLRTAFRDYQGLEPAGSWKFRARAAWIPVLTWAAATAVLAFALVSIPGVQPGSAPATAQGPGVSTANAAESEAVNRTAAADNGFIPLPNAAQVGPNDEVNLVRVEVPRAAMMSLGYDVKPEEASQFVQADVMLGTDGLARAVRFLD